MAGLMAERSLIIAKGRTLSLATVIYMTDPGWKERNRGYFMVASAR
jgi:hypothetical protein